MHSGIFGCHFCYSGYFLSHRDFMPWAGLNVLYLPFHLDFCSPYGPCMLTAVYHLQSQPQTPMSNTAELGVGLTGTQPNEKENVQELVRQNEHLRNKLREFTKKLDSYISGTHTQGKPPSQVVTTTKCESHEAQITSLNKRVDMLLRENAVLKKDLAASAPERVVELENELASTKKNNRKLQADIKALQADLRHAREGLANLPSEMKSIRDQEQVHAQTVERYREQLKGYQQRHDQDMRTMRQQQLQISDLEAKLRKTSTEQPAVLPPLASPPKTQKKRQPVSSSPQPHPAPPQRRAPQANVRSSGSAKPAPSPGRGADSAPTNPPAPTATTPSRKAHRDSATVDMDEVDAATAKNDMGEEQGTADVDTTVAPSVSGGEEDLNEDVFLPEATVPEDTENDGDLVDSYE